MEFILEQSCVGTFHKYDHTCYFSTENYFSVIFLVILYKAQFIFVSYILQDMLLL